MLHQRQQRVDACHQGQKKQAQPIGQPVHTVAVSPQQLQPGPQGDARQHIVVHRRSANARNIQASSTNNNNKEKEE